MSGKKSYLIIAAVLLGLPFLISVYKYNENSIPLEELIPRDVYEVELELDMSDIPADSYVKTYLPQSDHRQIVRNHSSIGDSVEMQFFNEPSGLKAQWNLTGLDEVLYTYQYEVEGKEVIYEIPESSPFEQYFDDSMSIFLASEPFIQSTHPRIDALAQSLKDEHVLSTLQANFEFVNQIENSNTRVLTDAVSVLELNRASCNGKSRLFTALCRAQGIPARVIGGTILENIEKRTSHLWSEAYYNGTWIPFDVLNKHFATLPANYLKLYTGDKFLFSYNSNLDFDYQFIIRRKYKTFAEAQAKGPHLWPLLSELQIPLNLLRTIMLLPLAALLIAIFRNVVGIKTFGILLPALIGLALVNVDLATGLLAFVVVIIVVSLLHPLLEKWSLLHVPKVVIILTCVILTLLIMGSFGFFMEWEIGRQMIFLPIVIISITAEKFAKVLIEENSKDAFKLLGNTFGVALMTCLIFKSKVLLGVFLTYPEHYLTLLFVMILLGRWIGLRVTEYDRFAPSIK
ncbi:MAG: 7TM domain-containing protein [Bacteroidota bacterium]